MRTELALIAKPIIEAKAREREHAGRPKSGEARPNSDEVIRTDTTLADMAGVGKDTVRKVETAGPIRISGPAANSVVRQTLYVECQGMLTLDVISVYGESVELPPAKVMATWLGIPSGPRSSWRSWSSLKFRKPCS